MTKRPLLQGTLLLIGASLIACSPDPAKSPGSVTAAEQQRPSILLVTLDTTRADGMGFESGAVETPNLDALAERGTHFSRAHATAPMTLPSHTSMFTGLYPAAHGIRENGRYVAEDQPLLATLLREQGYTTAAIVSAFSLASEFGLYRGFDLYDDDLGQLGLERNAIATTDRALSYLRKDVAEPLFLWVHYFDPHEPYEPPEPFRSRYESSAYLGEIALMDRELGRLLAEFEARFQGSDTKILVVGDHGQGLGEHGEDLHGKLLYQGVMRVPLLIAGTGVPKGKIDRPVSVRQVFHTILGWAGVGESGDLLTGKPEVVMAEALKPYLDYGWQPQVMAISGHIKVIRSGETEVYDLASDPRESRNLAGQIELDRELRRAISEYPIHPTSDGSEPDSLSQETRKRLASLGYIGSEDRPTLSENAPSPKDMTHLYRDLDLGATMFIQEEYAKAIPVFVRVLSADPDNLVACLRLAVAHSVLGHEEDAEGYFERARRVNSGSLALRYSYAVHLFRSGKWQRAEPFFEGVLAEMPKKMGVLKSMMQIREMQGRNEEARDFLRLAMAQQEPTAGEFLKLGELSMTLTDTPAAIDAFERARQLQGRDFTHALELGLCYIANRQLPEAASALDEVSQFDSEYPLALFKRAQLSVILGEPDREHRIRLAYEGADQTTRELIENDPLFRSVALR